MNHRQNDELLISKALLSGESKQSIFERMYTDDKAAPNLAHLIANFPDPKNYKRNSSLIRINYILTAGTHLLVIILVILNFKFSYLLYLIPVIFFCAANQKIRLASLPGLVVPLPFCLLMFWGLLDRKGILESKLQIFFITSYVLILSSNLLTAYKCFKGQSLTGWDKKQKKPIF